MKQLLSLLIVLCLFSTVNATGPYSDKAKAQKAARVQEAKERQERIQAMYIAQMKAYKAAMMTSKCAKGKCSKSPICHKYDK